MEPSAASATCPDVTNPFRGYWPWLTDKVNLAVPLLGVSARLKGSSQDRQLGLAGVGSLGLVAGGLSIR
jgi:hypothetical protein